MNPKKQRQNAILVEEYTGHLSYMFNDSNDFPKSEIVFNDYEIHDNNHDTIKTKMRNIYGKYIIEGSKFEINISGHLRRQYMYYFHHEFTMLKSNNDFVIFFDEIIISLFQLMSYSFSRSPFN